MKKVKIISNPYQKEIRYESWSEAYQNWKDIAGRNPDSELLNIEYTKKFFPFVAKEILDEIIREYEVENEPIELVFQGCRDEYLDLKALVESDLFEGQFHLSPSVFSLENATEIVPEINKIFQKIHPFITQAIREEKDPERKRKLEMDAARFNDVAKESIPVIVLGNYSSGKSTFINALIGREILPSGDKPLTAKMYRIEDSGTVTGRSNEGRISFDLDGNPVKIVFQPDSLQIDPLSESHPLLDRLSEADSALTNRSLDARMNRALELINGYDDDSQISISDVIEIRVPFQGGTWYTNKNNFILFDTPGSNTATNKSHVEILKSALEGMSDGLPIFLCTPSSLDSTDNESLYKTIHNVEEIDDRFSTIIINRADDNDTTLPKSDQEREDIMSLAVPRNLYNEGIFYVSSVMGLGSKIDGEFIGDGPYQTYEEKMLKFSKPDHRNYRCLYRHNIMPEQLYRKMKSECENESNLVYANSGLLAVENEIETFGFKYSPYNKCEQASSFLESMIDLTTSQLNKAEEESRDYKTRAVNRKEQKKKELLDQIRDEIHNSSVSAKKTYKEEMDQQIEAVLEAEHLDIEKVEETQDQFIKTSEDLYDEIFKAGLPQSEPLIQEKLEAEEFFLNPENSNGQDDLFTSFGNWVEIRVRKVSGWTDQKKMKGKFSQSVKGIEAKMDLAKLQQIRQKFTRIRGAELTIELINNQYSAHIRSASQTLSDESISQIRRSVNDLQKSLNAIVQETDSLDEEAKKDLVEKINSYIDVYLKNLEKVRFELSDFAEGWKINNLNIYSSNRVNEKGLTEQYNSAFGNALESVQKQLERDHLAFLKDCQEEIKTDIETNIVELNPTLKDYQKNIEDIEEKIKDLNDRREILEEGLRQSRDLMDWKKKA